MRILSDCFAVLALAAAAPQNSSDLRARYGQPDVERFAIRADVTVTAQYGPGGKACLFLIEPRQAFIHTLFIHQPTISKEASVQLLNEVAPPATRGKLPLGGATLQTGCTAFEADSYEHKNVGFVHGFCTKPGGVVKVQVNIKRPECDNGSNMAAESPEGAASRAPTGLSLSRWLGQTSADLHARYGEPDAARFKVRWGLAVTAENGTDDPACRMRIEPRYNINRLGSDDAAPPDMVADILNEMVPVEARGVELGSGEKIYGGCAGALPPTEYENVTINLYYGLCQRPLVSRGVDVLFKRDECAGLPKYSDK